MAAPLDPMNYEVTEGMMAITRRRLQTFTLHQAATGLFSVRDDRKGGQLSGAGFKTIDEAVAAFKYQDGLRIGAF